MHKNLTAYHNYEQFNDGFDVEAYRNDKIVSADGHVSFIRSMLGDKKLSVLELGSGNSKTLYALENNGLLETGYGIEISKERHLFAERWKSNSGFSKVRNICCDFTDYGLSEFKYIDLMFCVDLAFQFAEPAREGSDIKILSETLKALNPGGFVVLELCGIKKMLGEHAIERKSWEEFPESDPWRFSLWDCLYDKSKKFLNWKKIFIKRDGAEFCESEITLRIYSKEDISKTLSEAGFEGVSFYQDWQMNECLDFGLEFIVIAKKPEVI
jgi:hypothetical protein